MFFSQDMKDLLEIFRELDVQAVLVGGFAVNYYGYTRATQDIDLLVLPSQDNAQRVMEALSRFGFGAAGIPRELFEREGGVVHLGSEPNRIDLLTHLRGVSNDQVFSNRIQAELETIPIDVIALPDLIAAKRASSRTRDLADAVELEKLLGAHRS